MQLVENQQEQQQQEEQQLLRPWQSTAGQLDSIGANASAVFA
jgi:hypothetical protein